MKTRRECDLMGAGVGLVIALPFAAIWLTAPGWAGLAFFSIVMSFGALCGFCLLGTAFWLYGDD